MRASRTYVKTVLDTQRCINEQTGWEFFSRYYHKLPRLVAVNIKGAPSVTYEDLSPSGMTVTSALAAGRSVDLSEVFKSLADIVRTHGTRRLAKGGTQQFYLSRYVRLIQPDIMALYTQFAAHNSSLVINGVVSPINPELLSKVVNELESLRHGHCAPSQGDYHERNIFTSGYIIDFEAAGWNLVSTDIATFVWHTLFAGNYFGPQYADWSTERDKAGFMADTYKELLYADGAITVRPKQSRLQLVEDFLTYFVETVDIPPADDRKVSVAIAFRLLSMFSPATMSENDRALAFGLANYFFDPSRDYRAALRKLLSDPQSPPEKR